MSIHPCARGPKLNSPSPNIACIKLLKLYEPKQLQAAIKKTLNELNKFWNKLNGFWNKKTFKQHGKSKGTQKTNKIVVSWQLAIAEEQSCQNIMTEIFWDYNNMHKLIYMQI